MDLIKRLYAARICPVCGFTLEFTPWVDDSVLDRPCPCCGIHFGHDDAVDDRQRVYDQWRERWIEGGMPWWSNKPAPPDFNAPQQLCRLRELTGDIP
jgi:hypothetical protein